MRKLRATLTLAAITAIAACSVAAAPPTCDELGVFAAAVLDPKISEEDFKRMYPVTTPRDEMRGYAEIVPVLEQVMRDVPADQHHKVPNVIVHLCYARVGV